MAFTCLPCGGEFESQEQLEAHARQEHGGAKIGGFRCPACGGEFDSQESLDAHTREEHAA